MLENATGKIDGTIKLIAGEKENPTIQFITPQNKVYSESSYPRSVDEIHPIEVISNGKPKINHIIACLADICPWEFKKVVNQLN
ncbi:MAG: hypothetical protein PHC34_08370 [Candidatus Gastranaerophilales bacterium]|nr:hypothetical protein [Candidatus Gastranaerophilales bacterium]